MKLKATLTKKIKAHDWAKKLNKATSKTEKFNTGTLLLDTLIERIESYSDRSGEVIFNELKRLDMVWRDFCKYSKNFTETKDHKFYFHEYNFRECIASKIVPLLANDVRIRYTRLGWDFDKSVNPVEDDNCEIWELT